ncbi:hypothetical protein Droror1_Dr00020813 [Drosera rotundifolia]
MKYCYLFSHLLMQIFAEGLTPSGKIYSTVERRLSTTTVHRDIHASPRESFIVVFSEVMGSLKTLQKMAVLWSRIVTNAKGDFAAAEESGGCDEETGGFSLFRKSSGKFSLAFSPRSLNASLSYAIAASWLIIPW